MRKKSCLYYDIIYDIYLKKMSQASDQTNVKKKQLK